MPSNVRKLPSLRLLWVDDHPMVRQGVAALLRTEHPSAEVVEAASLAQARPQLSAGGWDLVGLDLSLSDGDGRELIREAGAPVLVFSLHRNPTLLAELSALGARGAVCKADPPGVLLEAVARLLAGGVWFPAAEGPRLSARELAVLRAVAAGKVPREIARNLSISTGAVQAYRSRLLRKFDLPAGTTADLVRLAVERGYLGVD